VNDNEDLVKELTKEDILEVLDNITAIELVNGDDNIVEFGCRNVGSHHFRIKQYWTEDNVPQQCLQLVFNPKKYQEKA
tara:strand:+ start:17146 stop:17379 length:234 start_codon:yes stop_codon:yes gene_type:complete